MLCPRRFVSEVVIFLSRHFIEGFTNSELKIGYSHTSTQFVREIDKSSIKYTTYIIRACTTVTRPHVER
jgi:hypothetical protein